MNADRFKQFSIAYTKAVFDAVKDFKPNLAGKTTAEFAAAASASMLDMVAAKGIEAIEGYGINTRGGAFRLVCDALGIQNDLRSMRTFLDGGV